MLTTALILLAGDSTRFSSTEKKQFFNIAGKPLIYYTISSFENSPSIDQIILVIKKGDSAKIKELIEKYSFKKIAKIVTGGETRQESVRLGLKAVTTKFVLIHDGARPLVPVEVIEKIVNLVKNTDAVIPVIKEENSVIKLKNGNLSSYEDRNSLLLVQTPQAFKTDLIKKLHDSCLDKNITDDAQLCLSNKLRLATVDGSKIMMKVTTLEDAYCIESFLKEGK